MSNVDKPDEQFKRLNPFDLTLTQSKRYNATIAGATSDKLMWEVIAGLSDEQIDYIKNGHGGAANMPYQDKMSVECDNGNYAMKVGRGLSLSHRAVGEKYSAHYLGEDATYLVALEGPEPENTPRMVIWPDGSLQWMCNPNQSTKNDMDMVMRRLQRAVKESTIDGRQWQEYMAAHHWKVA